MTKKWHRCDESCKINHANPVEVKKSKVKKVTLTTQPEKVTMSNSKALPLIDEIDFYVCKIDCEIETNKILEKTIIKLRKLEKDIG
jgi:hypothetical protein